MCWFRKWWKWSDRRGGWWRWWWGRWWRKRRWVSCVANHWLHPLKTMDHKKPAWIGNSWSRLMFSTCCWRLDLNVENYDITKSKIFQRLAVIQLCIFVKNASNYKKIMQPCHSTIECLKIVGHFRGIFEALDGEIRVTNFNYINSSFCDSNYMITNVNQRRKTFTLNTLPWHRHVWKTREPFWISI